MCAAILILLCIIPSNIICCLSKSSEKTMPSHFCVMMLPSLYFNALASLVLLVSSTLFLHIEAKNGDFSFHLIHRDSPKSPFYDPLLTLDERRRNAFQRSKDRADSFKATGVLSAGGEYLMKISYGKPTFETLALVDTGSFLCWTQCLPSQNCFKEKFPLFDPKNSSTFELVSCKAKECLASGDSFCHPGSKKCQYGIGYVVGFHTEGDLAINTVTLSLSTMSGSKQLKNVLFPKFIFGCGHDNGGATFPDMGSGIIGFGFANQSLVSQLYSSIQGKFSYCLGSLREEVSNSGRLNIGPNNVFSGGGVVLVPLFLDSFYILALEGISVEDKFFKHINTSLPSNLMVVDSGTTITSLPSALYQDLESTIKQKINSVDKIVPDPQNGFGLCYSSLEGIRIPNVTIHFKDADLELNPINTFVSTSNSSFCLAFFPGHFNYSILGNIQQVNYWVGYDL